MEEKAIRFGVVGLGMGVQHCRDLVDAAGCELAAVCDASPARLESNVQEFGVQGYAAYDELLADESVDVVNICTPSGTHAELCIAAMRAGKHVVCEKPPDVSVEAVDRMIRARDETGRKLMVIFQARFEPVYQQIRLALESGRLGRLIGVHGAVNWHRPASYFDSPGKWKGTWALDGGGSLANQGVHTADLMQWIGGPVAEVTAQFGCFAHDIESEDMTAALLRYHNGALGTLSTTTCAYPGLDRTLLLYGEHGSIRVSDDFLVRWRIRGESPEAEAEEEKRMLEQFGAKGQRDSSTASDPFAFATRGHLMQFEAMANAIRNDTTPPNSIETTRHTVELICAVYQSGRTGETVRLPPPEE